jgi:hypothetical protein
MNIGNDRINFQFCRDGGEWAVDILLVWFHLHVCFTPPGRQHG